MAVRLKHNELSRKIAARIVKEAYQAFPETGEYAHGSSRDPSYQDRCEFFQEQWGMTIGYVEKAIVGGVADEPSSRVLRQLPIEVWYKDPETGEMMEAEVPLPREGGYWAELNARRKAGGAEA